MRELSTAKEVRDPSSGVPSAWRVQSLVAPSVLICHTSIHLSEYSTVRTKVSTFPCFTRFTPSPSTLSCHSNLFVVRSNATREDFWAGYSASVDSGMLAYNVVPSHSNCPPLPESVERAGQLMRSNTLPVAASHIHMPVSYTHLRAHETRHDLVC